MKWLFLVNDAQFLPEFMAKLSREMISRGDSCVVVLNSKIAEFGKKDFFPEGTKFLSKVDWCISNYKSEREDFGNLSWKEMFPIFERFKNFKLSYKEGIEIASQAFSFVEFVFETEKPEAVIAEAPADIFHETVYYFCKKSKIKYLGIEESKFDRKIDIYDQKHICSKYEKDFLSLKNEDITDKEKDFASQFVDDFITHKLLPGYTDFYGVRFNLVGFSVHYFRRLKESGGILFRYLMGRRKFKTFDYESEAILKNGLKAPFQTAKRQIKILLQANVFEKLTEKDEKFFFFPLHFQPESSTSVYATYYYDQLNTVKNAAFCLPLPYKLYIKEHPASIGLRSGDFYKKIKSIPNVVLLSPHENVQEIIRKSSGVITLTGTIGMEAALSGKPSYVLGTTLYYHHPYCRKINGFSDLKIAIENDMEAKNNNKLHLINEKFLISYLRNTIDGSIVFVSKGKDINDYSYLYNKFKEFTCN